jgi:hypothetical protein
MMRRGAYTGVLALLSSLVVFAQEAPRELWRNDTHRMLEIVPSRQRLTTKWCFVIDSSHSTWNIAGRVMGAMDAALEHPTDQLRFSVFTFNNRGVHKFRDWVDASADEFKAAHDFVRDNRGVSSWVGGAMHDALHQRVNNLTIVLISDGGFTEPFPEVRGVIRDGQKWREDNSLGRSIICSIGLENMLCRGSRPPYPKDSNRVCQDRMREIGDDNAGGFFYVQPTESTTAINR